MALSLSSFSVVKRRHEFAAWHVAWPAEWHNYAGCDICRMARRGSLCGTTGVKEATEGSGMLTESFAQGTP